MCCRNRTRVFFSGSPRSFHLFNLRKSWLKVQSWKKDLFVWFFSCKKTSIFWPRFLLSDGESRFGMAQESSKWADLKAGVRESRRQFASLAVRVPTNFSFRKCLVGPNNQPATRIYFLATAQVRTHSLVIRFFWCTNFLSALTTAVSTRIKRDAPFLFLAFY